MPHARVVSATPVRSWRCAGRGFLPAAFFAAVPACFAGHFTCSFAVIVAPAFEMPVTATHVAAPE